MQRREVCSGCYVGFSVLVAVRMLTFMKCYYYHRTESTQILSKTEVVAMISHAQMLPSTVEVGENDTFFFFFFSNFVAAALLPTCDHSDERVSNCSPN